jgi:hypothetical protein
MQVHFLAKLRFRLFFNILVEFLNELKFLRAVLEASHVIIYVRWTFPLQKKQFYASTFSRSPTIGEWDTVATFYKFIFLFFLFFFL